MNSYQRSWFEVFDDRVLSDRQVKLVTTKNESMVYGVPHKVDAGAHDKGDNAEVDHRPGECTPTAFN